MKPSQNSLFKADTYVRSVAESRILGLVQECLAWLATLATDNTQVIIGIEGGETRHTLASYLLDQYPYIYEVNPLFTKQRRMWGTRQGKSDPVDAKLIAEVLTRKLSLLPKFHVGEFSPERFCLRKQLNSMKKLPSMAPDLKTDCDNLTGNMILPGQRKNEKCFL